MTYGPNQRAMFGRSASYIAKILQGTSPADLPIEQPTHRCRPARCSPARPRQTFSARFSARGPHRGSTALEVVVLVGAPGRSRTCDPRIRSPMLYPTELQARHALTIHWPVPAVRLSGYFPVGWASPPAARRRHGDDPARDAHSAPPG